MIRSTCPHMPPHSTDEPCVVTDDRLRVLGTGHHDDWFAIQHSIRYTVPCDGSKPVYVYWSGLLINTGSESGRVIDLRAGLDVHASSLPAMIREVMWTALDRTPS